MVRKMNTLLKTTLLPLFSLCISAPVWASQKDFDALSEEYNVNCVKAFAPLVEAIDPNQDGGPPDIATAEKTRQALLKVYPVCIDLVQKHIDKTLEDFPEKPASSKCMKQIDQAQKALDKSKRDLAELETIKIIDHDTHQKAHGKASIGFPWSISTALSKVSNAYLWSCTMNQ